jgi:signal transduction histidine kinase
MIDVVDIEKNIAGANRAPQVVILLDDEARVLNVNRGLAGKRFASIKEDSANLHSQLHVGCDGRCRFNELWAKAWASLASRDSIEWEIDDPELECLLRLNLSRTPAPKNVASDRRKSNKLLTITDITKYRREYEQLLEQQRALVKLLMVPGTPDVDSRRGEFDEAGDTGNRLMAGYIKRESSFSRQLILAQEKERMRIASELHDGIAQTIGVVKYRLEDSIARLAEQNPDLDLSMFDGAIDDIKGLVDEVRRISANLAPTMLEDFGLHVALEWLCREFMAQHRNMLASCSISIDEAETPDLVRIAIYRVVQEAMNNIGKHAEATLVEVKLSSTDEAVTLSITDDGKGLDKDAQRPVDGRTGLGMRSMRERVEATGGNFSMESRAGGGCVVLAQWLVADLDLIR